MKRIIMGTVALFFTCTTVMNFMYPHHHADIQHVLSNSQLAGHEIRSSIAVMTIYWISIIWQGLTAIFLWIGTIGLSKFCLKLGLFFGFIFFFLGLVTIGSEWFFMWQTKPDWTNRSILFSILMLGFLIYSAQDEVRHS